MAKKRLILFLAVFFILALIFFPSFSRCQKLALEKRRLEGRIKELEEENKKLEEEKYKLENDADYIERRAREKLGVVKENEIPYKIVK